MIKTNHLLYFGGKITTYFLIFSYFHKKNALFSKKSCLFSILNPILA